MAMIGAICALARSLLSGVVPIVVVGFNNK